MRSVHSMPFGSEPLARGGVRFALWAPATTRVELCFEGAVPVPMERDMDGWAQNHDQTVDWSSLVHPEHRRRRQWIRRLLRLRQQEIVPLLALGRLRARMTRFGATGLGVEWTCADGTVLRLVANLGPVPVARPAGVDRSGRRLFVVSAGSTGERVIGAWHVAYYLADER